MLGSPHMMGLPLVFLSNRSNLRKPPRYSAAFTVRSFSNSDAAATTVHSGIFHTIALYAPLFYLIRSDPSKLTTKRLSPSSTVGGGINIVSLCYLFGAMAISISSNSDRGAILTAGVRIIPSSTFSHLLTSKVQFDNNAAHLPGIPWRIEYWTKQVRVEHLVRILFSRDTIIT